jgi:hypothetical protein
MYTDFAQIKPQLEHDAKPLTDSCARAPFLSSAIRSHDRRPSAEALIEQKIIKSPAEPWGSAGLGICVWNRRQ